MMTSHRPPDNDLLRGLTQAQLAAVSSTARRQLLIAGAGSGKTEVMARRVAWWLSVDGVPKENIVAFTFTERAAEEMKFRIRKYVQLITPDGDDATLGGMYVGTIHGYCLQTLRSHWAAEYHNYDILDDVARSSLIQGGFNSLLGLVSYQQELGAGRQFPPSRTDTITSFLKAYDLLNEYGVLDVELPSERPPTTLGGPEAEWCKRARLRTEVGSSTLARLFAVSAARFYAFLRCRRFLDFSTSQTELIRALQGHSAELAGLRATATHVVVDEVQDVNPVQNALIRLIVGDDGHLTAVGDHRQAIFAFRGGRVRIMGQLAQELAKDPAGEVLELTENFRSTPRIIRLSNSWNNTITTPPGLTSPDMLHGRRSRTDDDKSHVAAATFPDRQHEAEWIAKTVRQLVPDGATGARHDTAEAERGLTLADVCVLIRSSHDARTYMRALQDQGVGAVVRAGADLFAQPEVLLVLSGLAEAAAMPQFMGRVIRERIAEIGSPSDVPADVAAAGARILAREGVPIDTADVRALLRAGSLISRRIDAGRLHSADVAGIRSPELRRFLTAGPATLRRVFPQSLLQHLLAELHVDRWDSTALRSQTAMFHLGQLSSLVTGIETRGWTSTQEFKYQIQALIQWGALFARPEEAPLLVTPDAVQILTIHTAKGLEFGAVFVADVVSSRFPSSMARRQPQLPFDGPISAVIPAADLADNANLDDERRLMYVALTRAERYLYVSTSRASSFFRGASGIQQLVRSSGGEVWDPTNGAVPNVQLRPAAPDSETKLVTSFSDLRYFLECGHDFYLRKVLGFAPTIDQAFGYGRGVHNLLREVHTNPKSWSAIAGDRAALESRLQDLVDRGLFYLRHTVGDPADRMKRKAVDIVADYVEFYRDELDKLEFEPEREFETLIPSENVLVSGSIDLVRLEDPPRVSIVDFKSGEPESDARLSLDEDEMRFQVTLYGLAAKHELEYEPDRGLVRYIGETGKQIEVDLSAEALEQAEQKVATAARGIKNREFHRGPTGLPRLETSTDRCDECDFLQLCGQPSAGRARQRAGYK